MPHHDSDRTTISLALELLTQNGFGGMADALQLLLNEAMLIERSEYLGANPYERIDDRRGCNNGFNPKPVSTRIGMLGLCIPQVREADEEGRRFYLGLLSVAYAASVL